MCMTEIMKNSQTFRLKCSLELNEMECVINKSVSQHMADMSYTLGRFIWSTKVSAISHFSVAILTYATLIL